MRYCAFLLIVLGFVFRSAAQEREALPVIRFDSKPLPEVLREIESFSAVRFFFRKKEIDTVRVTVNGRFPDVQALLDEALYGKGVYYIFDASGNAFVSRYRFQKEISGGYYRDGPVTTPSSENTVSPERIVVAKEQVIGNKLYEIGNKRAYIAGASATLSGYIRAAGGAPVDGASIQVEKLGLGAVADQKGYYSLALPSGRHELLIRSVGMNDARRMIMLFGTGTLDIEMSEHVTNLDEVIIESDNLSAVKRITPGVERLTISEIKNVPTVFGETDVIRVIMTLPGVKSVGEASTGFNVRGGATDQNLILYNDVTIYNPSHFFGFFSAFNPEMVKDVELYKSLMPARYGGRLSSVLQVTGKEGNSEKIRGSAGIGLLTSRVNVEGPILKGKTMFNVGARTTYSNWLFGLMPEGSGFDRTKASFHDANLNLTHRLSDRGTLMLTGYISNDESNLNTDTLYTYNNKNISLRWSHDFNSAVHASFSVGRDHYGYTNHFTVDSLSAYGMEFRLNQDVFKANFDYSLNDKHELEFGINSTLYRIGPTSFNKRHPNSLVAPVTVDPEQGIESALYLEDQFQVNDELSFSAGLRYSIFNYLGPQAVRTYPANVPRTEETILGEKDYASGSIITTHKGLDYRISLRYAFTKTFSVKAAYATARQFIHMLSNTVAISPTDTWKLSDQNIRPQRSQQYSVGLFKNLFDGMVETSIEGYRKDIRDYLDYKSGANLLVNEHVETEVFTTRGKAYGIELMVRKSKGKTNGWVSYTYARTFLRTDDPIAGELINKGRYYPANFDKPHDFTFVGNQKLTRRVSLSMNLTYSTGRPVTIPIGTFYYGGAQKTLYSDRNGYRIPDYFRTDLSVNIEGNHKIRQLTHNSWTIGFYNLTSRNNPYSIYFIAKDGVVRGYKLSIFGAIIPFVNYNIRF